MGNGATCSSAACGLLSAPEKELATVKVDLTAILPQAQILQNHACCDPPGLPSNAELNITAHSEAAHAVAVALEEVARIKAERYEQEERMRKVLWEYNHQRLKDEEVEDFVHGESQGIAWKPGSSPIIGDPSLAMEMKTQEDRFEDEDGLKRKVDAFLAEHKFSTITAKRRRWLNASYPLHVAVERRDAEMVALLLKAGADPSKQDSFGRTPKQLARKRNRSGSHDQVLSTLEARCL
mmetsp:Transcript_94360/g.147469  ORF Transcript_94360/g.147469 Transcript_94360/m.147469 type:complete len:237 (-) Transcript_94360:14-724(-)